MAQPQLIQGSWEELCARADEFKNRRDLLLIIPGDPEARNDTPLKDKSLAEVLKGKTGLVSFEPTDLSEDTGKKFGDLLVEKNRTEHP